MYILKIPLNYISLFIKITQFIMTKMANERNVTWKQRWNLMCAKLKG